MKPGNSHQINPPETPSGSAAPWSSHVAEGAGAPRPDRLAVAQSCALIIALALWVLGCATSEVNPAQPRANTGYVDLRAEPAQELYWEVSRFDQRADKFVRVYSKLQAPPDGILRLAFPPGLQRLRIGILNRLTTSPVEVQLEVQETKITPVLVTLTPVSASSVQTQEPNWAGMARGRYGKRTKITENEASQSQLAAKVSAPVAYQPRGQITY